MPVVDTLDLQRSGYLALAVAGGAASLGILALILARVARLQPAEGLALSALGCTPRQLRSAVLVPGTLVAAVAGGGAVLLAALAQGAVPTGLAERIGVGPRLGDDLGFLALCGFGAAAALLAVVALAARPPRQTGGRARPTSHRSTLWRWPAGGAGLRAAAGGLASAGRRQALAGFTAVAIATVGICAVAVLVGSRDGLRQHPSRVGKFFDVWLYTYADTAVAVPDRDSGVPGRGRCGDHGILHRTAGVGTPAIAVTRHKGDLAISIVEGPSRWGRTSWWPCGPSSIGSGRASATR